jgi:hypothetical protein
MAMMVNAADAAPTSHQQEDEQGTAVALGQQQQQLQQLLVDDDITTEAQTLADRLEHLDMEGTTVLQDGGGGSGSGGGQYGDGGGGGASGAAEASSVQYPLNWKRGAGGHKPNAATRQLLEEAGGREGLLEATTAFYQLAFRDPVIDLFIREHSDPHGHRFANWIAEKMGDETEPWTRERATRQTCPFSARGHTFQTPHDRSSAHYAAWHSPKRELGKFGRKFKLDDCRIWMRLHFWAFRATGMFDRSPSFMDYYVKFIGHFVSVYEGSAPPFARESARWSAEPSNVQAYIAAGRRMPDVEGISRRDAIQQLPQSERDDHQWPYV